MSISFRKSRKIIKSFRNHHEALTGWLFNSYLQLKALTEPEPLTWLSTNCLKYYLAQYVYIK